MEMIKDYCAGMNYDSEIVIGEIKGLDSLDFEEEDESRELEIRVFGV